MPLEHLKSDGISFLHIRISYIDQILQGGKISGGKNTAKNNKKWAVNENSKHSLAH